MSETTALSRSDSVLSRRPRSDQVSWLMAMARTATFFVPAGILILVAVRGPAAGLVVVAGLAVLVVLIRRPEVGLAVGSLATLAGGSFSAIAAWGGFLLLAGGCVSGAILLTRSPGPAWRRLLLPALILLWLALRFALEGDLGAVADIVRCAAALVLVLDCIGRGRNLIAAFSWCGAIFVTASATIGVYSPTGLRFEGISGNPNRMSLGLLLISSLLGSVLLMRLRLAIRLAVVTVLVAAVVLILRSGSLQGIAGLVVVTAVWLACWAQRWSKARRIVVGCIGLAAAAVVAGPALDVVRASPDLETLSGRTPIYAAALNEILRSPWVGSGQQHFFTSGTSDRSAHSVILAMAVAGGIGLGLAWIAVLLVLSGLAWRLVKAGNMLAAAPVVLIAEQFVQTYHLVPFGWALVGMLVAIRDPAELAGGARPGSPRSGAWRRPTGGEEPAQPILPRPTAPLRVAVTARRAQPERSNA